MVTIIEWANATFPLGFGMLILYLVACICVVVLGILAYHTSRNEKRLTPGDTASSSGK